METNYPHYTGRGGPYLKQKALPYKGREKDARTPSLAANILKYSKGNGKSTSPYETRSQNKVPPPEVTSNKRRLVL